jgi:hypothetical protein
MTPKARTLRAALDLFTTPALARRVRHQPLPDAVGFLLLVATGDGAALREAQTLSGRDPAALQKAAAFFVEQVLLEAGSDSYRMLGAHPVDPIHKIRHHMALLMRWLHPDLDPEGQRALLAPRVIAAWDQLKSPDRRRAYDAKSAPRQTSKTGSGLPHASAVNGGRKRHRGACEMRAVAPAPLFNRRGRWGLSSLLPRPLFVALCRLLYR